MKITSEKNPRIQHIIKLRDKSRDRKKERLFVIEGLRELELAMKGGTGLKEILICPDVVPVDALTDLRRRAQSIEWTEISRNVYEKLAVRESTEGVIAIGEMRDLTLDGLKPDQCQLLLIIERVEKPGNLGALLRTADAAGVSAVIVCDQEIDVYNPNVIRASLGCLFTTQIAVTDTGETILWLKKNGLKIFAATPEGNQSYAAVNLRQSCAVVVGSEAEGLSDKWKRAAEAQIAIPMRGAIDSLNVSVSAAVILFEAVRQRMQR